MSERPYFQSKFCRFMQMQDINTRMGEIWNIVINEVDFSGKSVLDLGCGAGDFCRRAMIAGAGAIGYDRDCAVAIKRHGKESRRSDLFVDFVPRFSPTNEIMLAFYENDLDKMVREYNPGYDHSWGYDIVSCFSVLPYLKNCEGFLRFVYAMGSQKFILETQYKGDRDIDIENDEQMRKILYGVDWKTVRKIGSTTVKDGRYERSIWLCER